MVERNYFAQVLKEPSSEHLSLRDRFTRAEKLKPAAKSWLVYIMTEKKNKEEKIRSEIGKSLQNISKKYNVPLRNVVGQMLDLVKKKKKKWEGYKKN